MATRSVGVPGDSEVGSVRRKRTEGSLPVRCREGPVVGPPDRTGERRVEGWDHGVGVQGVRGPAATGRRPVVVPRVVVVGCPLRTFPPTGTGPVSRDHRRSADLSSPTRPGPVPTPVYLRRPRQPFQLRRWTTRTPFIYAKGEIPESTRRPTQTTRSFPLTLDLLSLIPADDWDKRKEDHSRCSPGALRLAPPVSRSPEERGRPRSGPVTATDRGTCRP